MKAPKIQRTGKKIPRKNIHPCPFLRVINPSVNATTKYKKAAPMPIPHHMISSGIRAGLGLASKCGLRGETAHHPMRMRP
jgi:hypothetical protein